MKEKSNKKLVQQRDAVFASVFGRLKSNIDFSFVESRPYTVLFTSSLPDEGKTTIAVNTAVAMAASDAKTLIIDVDMRNPSLHLLFNSTNTKGLSDLISSEGDWHPFILSSKVPNLFVLTAGRKPTNPVKFLSSPRFKELLSGFSKEFDYIVIDSPPLLLVPDSQIVSACVDGVVLVVRNGKTTAKALKEAKALLDHANANLIGSVLNVVNEKDSIYGYGYGYGYQYGSNASAASSKEKVAKRQVPGKKTHISIVNASNTQKPETRAVRRPPSSAEFPPVQKPPTRPGREVNPTPGGESPPRISIPE